MYLKIISATSFLFLLYLDTRLMNLLVYENTLLFLLLLFLFYVLIRCFYQRLVCLLDVSIFLSTYFKKCKIVFLTVFLNFL